MVARKAGRAPRIDDIRAWMCATSMALVKVLEVKKSAGGVSTAACSRRGGIDVAERGASREVVVEVMVVCATAMHDAGGWVDEKLVASDDGRQWWAGWLGELLRDSAGPCGYAESTGEA